MTIIALPRTSRFIRKIDWSLDRPAQINVSGYTGKRTVVANPWHGKWRARIDMAPIVGEANILAWRAFFGQLRGEINTFRLPAAEAAQNGNSGVTASATAAGAQSMTISGAATAIKAGQFVTVNDQLLLVTSVAGSVLSFEPALRVAVASGGAVETANPTCLVSLVGSRAGWSVDVGQSYSMSFDVEEVI